VKRLLNITASGMFVVGMAIAGCGGSGSSASSATQAANVITTSSNAQATPKSSASNAAPATTAKGGTEAAAAKTRGAPLFSLRVSSPALGPAKHAIPSRYTCDGADISLPLRWRAIPHGIAELALVVASLNTSSGEVESYSWMVAGLRPTLRRLNAGELPAGAIVGRNSAGQSRYTVCPAKGSGTHHYVAILYALPHAVAAKPGVSAAALAKTVKLTASYGGGVGFTYTRK
jgi:phosphatidylethanolamine-binding protein (PEBP) family uncharacterized protein